MSQFSAPRGSFSTAGSGMMPMNNTQMRPASPPSMGYVSGAEQGKSDIVGVIGVKPKVVESGGNPQSLRQNTNFASPHADLAQSAFTQSNFTSNITSGLMQTQAARNQLQQQQAPQEQSLDPAEARREALRRHKEQQGNSRGYGQCGISPHPSLSQQRNSPGNNQQNRYQNTGNGRGNLQQNQQLNMRSGTQEMTQEESLSPSSPNNSNSGNNGANNSTYIGYVLHDPGAMYSSFSSSTSWFRVMQIIVSPNLPKLLKQFLKS